jgi:copper/silver efflux system protein
LNSLPAGLLARVDAQPALGPDATALGQIFWYTLEGRDPHGEPAGGWDLHELRSVQDWYVRYGLLAAEGISEVASIGGYVREYQVDVDPDALRARGVTLQQVFDAVRMSNRDVGARVTEINQVEYVVRGSGLIRDLEDIERAAVGMGADHVPVLVRDVATVQRGPAQRRGALTVMGAEAVGGVVVVREGYNPLAAIGNVKAKIDEIRPGLPARAVIDWSRVTRAEAAAFAAERGFEGFVDGALNHEAWTPWLRSADPGDHPEWVTLSRVDIVPVYDRTGLIYETLATLSDALVQQILVTVIVVIVMLMHLRTALIVSAMLPMAVLMAFIMMKLFGVDANVVALAGIAIAIGTIVDMGVIVVDNVLRHLDEADPEESRLAVVHRGAREVGSAILTAISTTVISFLPVFTMTGAEGKMFIPLAFTKTFVLIASVVVALTVVPTAVHLFVARRAGRRDAGRAVWFMSGLAAVAIGGVALARGWTVVWVAAAVWLAVAVYQLLAGKLPAGGRFAQTLKRAGRWGASVLAVIGVVVILATVWEPLGPERGLWRNLFFIVVLIGGVLGLFHLIYRLYAHILRWCLAHKAVLLSVPALLVLLGLTIWLGFGSVFGFMPALYGRLGGEPRTLTASRPWSTVAHAFPGLGREFMPPLDEGAFLWMPTTMPHASFGEVLEVLQFQDVAMASVPEVDEVIGKLGRTESALDPAPVSMIESIIHYKPEYRTDDAGRRMNFKYDRHSGEFVRDAEGNLIPDRRGRPYRQWRDHIRSPRTTSGTRSSRRPTSPAPHRPRSCNRLRRGWLCCRPACARRWASRCARLTWKRSTASLVRSWKSPPAPGAGIRAAPRSMPTVWWASRIWRSRIDRDAVSRDTD